MKIEKINDNQIRCTLTPDDLQSRDIRISELTYGSGKARSLFRDMMTEAFKNYGFRVDNTPIMVEAMPDSEGNLTLLITKVRDPEEIDSRFAHYTPAPGGGDPSSVPVSRDMPGADDVLRILQKASEDSKGAAGGTKSTPAVSGAKTAAGADSRNSAGGRKEPGSQLNTVTREELFGYTRFFLFHTLESVIGAAKSVGDDYAGGNTLFKNPDDGEFYLLIRKDTTAPERFNQICNVLSEYGLPMDFANGTDEFFHEHMKVIVEGRAVQQLRTL